MSTLAKVVSFVSMVTGLLFAAAVYFHPATTPVERLITSCISCFAFGIYLRVQANEVSK